MLIIAKLHMQAYSKIEYFYMITIKYVLVLNIT